MAIKPTPPLLDYDLVKRAEEALETCRLMCACAEVMLQDNRSILKSNQAIHGNLPIELPR